MMTVHVLHAGDGYLYLIRSVAAHDARLDPGESLAAYYTASGQPPGRWSGRGANRLDVRGVVTEEQMKALFGEGMQLIDRLRDRLTIPLRNQQEEMVGFTGRLGAVHDQRQGAPKYLNTPTTALFRKGEVVYGLGEHRENLAKGHTPVVCEGPLDALAVDLLAVKAGSNLIGLAACGTAFTQEHARQLLDAVGDRTVCLALDGDQAGRVATQAVWRTLTASGPHYVVVADLPTGSDPASLFHADPDGLSLYLRSAGPAAEVIAARRIDDANIAGNVGKELLAFRELVGLAARVPAPQRTEYVLRLADKLRIEPAEAAAEVASCCPDLLQERVMDTCRRIDQSLDEDRQDGLRSALPHQLPDRPELVIHR